jgi:hypothetical protein
VARTPSTADGEIARRRPLRLSATIRSFSSSVQRQRWPVSTTSRCSNTGLDVRAHKVCPLSTRPRRQGGPRRRGTISPQARRWLNPWTRRGWSTAPTPNCGPQNFPRRYPSRRHCPASPRPAASSACGSCLQVIETAWRPTSASRHTGLLRSRLVQAQDLNDAFFAKPLPLHVRSPRNGLNLTTREFQENRSPPLRLPRGSPTQGHRRGSFKRSMKTISARPNPKRNWRNYRSRCSKASICSILCPQIYRVSRQSFSNMQQVSLRCV